MDRYKSCLDVILAAEGGYVNDPTDRGGATNKGITQRTYNAWLTKHQLPLRSVEDIDDEEVSEIYEENYWVSDLPYLIDLCVFDAAVQHGRVKAIRWLQTVVKCPTDGISGKNTIFATNAYKLTHSTKELLQEYIKLRRAFYRDIILNDPTQAKYKKGWENRLIKLEGILYGV